MPPRWKGGWWPSEVSAEAMPLRAQKPAMS
jgi:hypothetical protein